MTMDWTIGDKVTLQKAHPCGGYEWGVYRVGADIGIRCMLCGRRFLIARRDLEKRVKKLAQSTRDSD